jgi:hypothetical protein
MNGMIIQKVAAKAPQRILTLVAIAPVSAHGQPLDENQQEGLREMARERKRAEMLRAMWGERLSESWLQFKLRRWRETAEAEASVGYTFVLISYVFKELRSPALLPKILGSKAAERTARCLEDSHWETRSERTQAEISRTAAGLRD